MLVIDYRHCSASFGSKSYPRHCKGWAAKIGEIIFGFCFILRVNVWMISQFFNAIINISKNDIPIISFQTSKTYLTRPSKQCKSLIWILVFVFPVVICHRKRRVRQFWQIFNYSGNRQCVITKALQCQCSSITLLYLLNRWSVWAEILYWGSSLQVAGLVRISAQEAGSSRRSFAKIRGPPVSQIMHFTGPK